VTLDERTYAGGEHVDPAYVEGYDRKTGFDAGPDVALLESLGLHAGCTVVDLGAGTGLFAAAVAVLESWYARAPSDPADGWTPAELETHVQSEYSTFSWLLEPLLERAGFTVGDVWQSESRTYARYVCAKR
jgi:hypothetical protein